MPFSPFFTRRPSWFHVYIPATLVAVGFCRAMARMFPKLYVISGIMLSGMRRGAQGAGFRALRLT
jgi:hypothetical protein